MKIPKYILKDLVIFVDSREQKPLRFAGGVKTQKVTLSEGDYAFAFKGVNYSLKIGFERKEIGDFVNCCMGDNRERLKREFQRASNREQFFLVIETDLRAIWGARLHSRIPRSALTHSAYSFMVQFPNLKVIWASNRTQAADFILYFIVSFIKHRILLK